jgi:hypothetical protein
MGAPTNGKYSEAIETMLNDKIYINSRFNGEVKLNPAEVFYLWVLHPVAHLSNWFLMTLSIATKF